jgi:hypothetical protein
MIKWRLLIQVLHSKKKKKKKKKQEKVEFLKQNILIFIQEKE